MGTSWSNKVHVEESLARKMKEGEGGVMKTV